MSEDVLHLTVAYYFLSRLDSIVPVFEAARRYRPTLGGRLSRVVIP